jgi:hypothetical protein
MYHKIMLAIGALRRDNIISLAVGMNNEKFDKREYRIGYQTSYYRTSRQCFLASLGQE